ncbi:putative protein RSN1 [Rhizoctonia solani]|uniref:CSC1/OSCA1-like 7TM region domain-containing protein n=1 Tax=Rhizoctonia solani TaxID=456999 RepID=A0A0K6GDA9_9AGAM|nr:putative protein RSN1 [Rhizoctonia solani]
MGEKAGTIEWARNEVIESDQLLTKGRRKLAEDRANGGVDMNNNYPPLNSAFIFFNQQIGAHIAGQILVHNQPYRMAEKYTEVALADVIWGNLGINPYEARIRKAISYAATAALMVFWAIPVSKVAQLCVRFSWMRWLCKLPDVIVGIISGILPSVALAILMMLLPTVLRLLARFEGIPRFTGLEPSLMTRYFIFQVVHSFLIVTLSSGIIAALPQLASNPTSIPTILAQKLPEASTFFLTYAILQGLAGSAGGLLQILPLYFGVPTLDEGNRRQLVHETPYIEYPSLMVRFAARLGLTNGNKSMMNAVESAYSFLSENYKPGDQVILYVNLYQINSVLVLKAAETLAKHLHDGTRPGDRSESQRSRGSSESPGKIPIYGVVVEVVGETRGMGELNDELKSRFPPGIEHIICCTYDGGDRSCATRFDMTGGIVWREICISPDGDWYIGRHCTKHVIYYREDKIPKWYKGDPVWTQELDSSPGSAQDGFGWGLTKPVGMYRHELRKCHRLDWRGRDTFMLVWKSYRGVDQSRS